MKSTNRHAPTLEILTYTLTAMGRLGTQLSRVLCGQDHRKAVAVTINPKGYSDWRDFMLDYAALNLVKKYPYLNLPGVNPAQVAVRKFLQSEDRCRRVNFLFAHPTLIPHETRVLLTRARREIKRVLGKFCLDDIVPFLSHGPGATFGTRKDRGHPWYKFGDTKPTVTGECLALHSVFIKYCEVWGNFHTENAVDTVVVGGSRITTVPKDARSDRVIAIEPLLNMFYQKGIGGLMRSRLKKSGCNLDDQRTNQGLALVGSVDNSLATIDLSSASDSISRGLVEYLLPPDWLMFLNATRSNQTTFSNGEFVYLQKYSSMGNGFTFELESLIFLALCRAVSGSKENVVSVYGDDIIVNREMASSVISLLDVCGFATNVEKTFIDGPFRESCGKHYFLGHDVTPLYVKEDIQSQDRYLWYLNSLKRFAHRLLGVGFGLDGRLQEVYTFVYTLLDPKIRSLSIPEGFGDGGVVRDFDECSPKPSAQHCWVQGYTTRHLTRAFYGFTPHGVPQLLVSLFRLNSQSVVATSVIRAKDDIPLIVPTKRYRWRVSKLAVPRWVDLGPWVSSF